MIAPFDTFFTTGAATDYKSPIHSVNAVLPGNANNAAKVIRTKRRVQTKRVCRQAQPDLITEDRSFSATVQS